MLSSIVLEVVDYQHLRTSASAPGRSSRDAELRVSILPWLPPGDDARPAVPGEVQRSECPLRREMGQDGAAPLGPGRPYALR